MDSNEWNKVIGSVLATVLFVLVVNIISEGIFAAPEPAEASYKVPGAQTEGTAPAAVPAATPAETLPDFATVLASADVMAGAEFAERCVACHDWTKGGPNKIGPNLYDVVGRARASHPGFEYSSALREKPGSWTYEELFRFLAQPLVYVPGTKMGFAGIPRVQDRLNVIAFLRMQADTPAPLR